MDGDWVESKDQDPNGDVRLVQLADVGDGCFTNRSSRFLTSAKADELRCTFLRAGDVLIARMPDPLGRACVFPGDGKPCVTVVDVCLVRSPSAAISHRWLMWAVNAPSFRAAIAKEQRGSTRKRIARSSLAALAIPVPPRNEQDRIAAAVDQHLSDIDAGIAALERALLNLKRYRASILKNACEGKLVPTEAELARKEGREYEPAAVLLERILTERRARWEAEQLAKMAAKGQVPKDDKWKARYEEPKGPETSELAGLPEGWVWTTLRTISELRGGITKGQKRRQEDVVRRVPYLRVANVQRGKLDLDEVKEIEATEEEIEELKLIRGDILFNEGGDRDKLGRGWIWEDQLPLCIHQNHVFRARIIGDHMHPKLLSWYGNSNGQKYFLAQGKQTTNLASINMTKLGALPVSLPPQAEQAHIVAEVDRLLSITDEAENAIHIQLARAEVLRRAVLKAAFVGKLVPQDPKDGTAAELLEAIRKAKAEAAERAELARKSKTDSGRLNDEQGDTPAPAANGESPSMSPKATEKHATSLRLEDILAKHGKPMRPEELFRAAGYTSSNVDAFYTELRRLWREGKLDENSVERPLILLRPRSV